MKPHKRSLSLIFLFSMLGITLPSILILGYLWIFQRYECFYQEVDTLKSDYIESRKASIKNEVNRVIEYINYNRSLSKQRLKADIRNRVYEACAIAEHLYNENRAHKSPAEIRKMVIDAIRPMRYNNNRGYYFIVDIDGTARLIPTKTELEGINIIDTKDADGDPVVRRAIELAQTAGEGFYEYKWHKPGLENSNHLKISFGKYFEPLKFLICTGEYLEDIRNDIQKEIFDYVDKIRFGNDDYVTLIKLLNIEGGDKYGVMLVNPNTTEMIGQYLSDERTDTEGNYFVKKMLSGLRSQGEAFVSYRHQKPGARKPQPKISFFKLYREWDLIVAASSYTDDIEAAIGKKRTLLTQHIRHETIQIIIVILLLIAGATAVAHYIARRIKHNLRIFTSFFEKAATESEPIDTGDFYTTEFEALAQAANQMISKRQRAEATLEKVYDMLEFKVEERTAELIETNQMLESEVEERRRMEEILRLEKGNLNNILNSMKDGVCIINRDYAIEYANPGLIEAFGSLEDRKCYEYFHDFTERCQHCKTEKVFTGETVRWGWKSPANQKNYNLVATPVKNPDGTLSSLHIFHDITDIKMLQNQLICTERLAATGQLAASIAHEINSPLQGITALLHFLQKTVSENRELSENLELLKNAFNSIRDTVKKLQDLNRPAKEKIQIFDVNSVIGDNVALISTYLKKNRIRIELHPCSESSGIKGSPQLIGQVIMNLINNAAEAIIEKSSADKKKRDPLSDSNKIRIDTRVQGGSLLIQVSDSGPGISDNALPQIFEPFYTTKKSKGMGVGLSICHKIIADHKGTITASNAPDGGALFTISLPLTKTA